MHGFAARPGSRKHLRALTRWVAREALLLWLVARDRRSPWLVRLVCALAAAYVFSPVQLLPDFVPVLGWLDDFAVVALARWIALKLTPPGLVAELRAKAELISGQPTSWRAAVVILVIWIAGAVLCGVLVWNLIAPAGLRLPVSPGSARWGFT